MTNDKLTQILVSGDKEAFYKVMETYNKLLWVVVAGALNKLGTVEDIEECICDVYIDLWENPNIYNPQKGIFKTFVTVTAKRKAHDRYKQLVKRKDISSDVNIGSNDSEPTGYGLEMIAYIPEQFEECSISIKNLFFKRAKSRLKSNKKTSIRKTIIVVVIIFISITTALIFSESFRVLIFGAPEEDISPDDDIIISDEIIGEDIFNLMRVIVDLDTDSDKFYYVGEDGELREVTGIPFTINLHSSGEGEFEYIFYSLFARNNIIAVPSQWNVMAFTYLSDADSDSFFACTDTGIYRIDPLSRTATLISSEEHNGVPYEELFERYLDSRGFHLTWISNPVLSPDGEWIAFQSNRGDADSLPSFRESLWVLNTKTGEEKIIPVNNEYSQVPEGFLSSNILLVRNVGGRIEAGINLSVADLLTATAERVSLGHAPNANISSLHSTGLLAVQVSDDLGVREVIYNISRNGSSNIAFEIEGHLHYTKFSPCGRRLAAIFRETRGSIADAAIIDTVIVVDTGSGAFMAINELENRAHASGLSWVDSNQFIVTENSIVDGRIRETTVLYTLGKT